MTAVITARRLGDLLEEAAIASDSAGYQHRDPARVSPLLAQRLAERDKRYAEPDTAPGMSVAANQVASIKRRAEFARLREAEVSVADAGAAVGITARTARRYERRRLAALGTVSSA